MPWKVITALRDTTSIFYFGPVVKVSFLSFVKGGNHMNMFLLNCLKILIVIEQTSDLLNPNGNIGCQTRPFVLLCWKSLQVDSF